MMNEKAPNNCFKNNLFLCRLLNENCAPGAFKTPTQRDATNPFIAYNSVIATETPGAWAADKPSLKSKVLFQEYHFGSVRRSGKNNTIAIYTPSGVRRDIGRRIVTIDSLKANDIVIDDPSVSRRHCAIVNYPEDVWLYDLESTRGRRVDGQRLTGRMFLQACMR